MPFFMTAIFGQWSVLIGYMSKRRKFNHSNRYINLDTQKNDEKKRRRKKHGPTPINNQRLTIKFTVNFNVINPIS